MRRPIGVLFVMTAVLAVPLGGLVAQADASTVGARPRTTS